MTLAELNARALEARIADRAPTPRIAARLALIKACAQLTSAASWAIDPEEIPSDHDYWAQCVIEQAHEIINLAHAFKQTIAAKHGAAGQGGA